MSTNEIVTTVVGWAATAPREIHAGGTPYTSFRLAATPRHYDRRQQVWVEGRTEWITVKAFRRTALNVAMSIHKGDPVVVTGRLRTEEWQGENGTRYGLVLEATSLGHDLSRGRSSFVKTSFPGTDGPGGSGGPGGPGDDGPGDGDTDGPQDAPSVPEAVAAELAALADDDLDGSLDDALDELAEDLAEDLAAGATAGTGTQR
jgi:single-strand DNA-binding protein